MGKGSDSHVDAKVRVWKVKVSLSRARLCDPMDCSPPGSSVHGILQARILEWVAKPSSRGSSQPGDQTHISISSALASEFFTTNTTWEALGTFKVQSLPSLLGEKNV